MLKRLLDVPEGIDAFAAVGTITRDDYEQAVQPLLDEGRRRERPLRLLLQIGPEYEGFTAGAVWEKTATAFRSPSLLRLFDGYAVVTDIGRLHEASRLMALFLPFPLRVFHDGLIEAAASADELVLGHRGRGAVGSALLGSVGLHCVLDAPCPVTVVRPAAVDESAPEPAATAVAARV